MGVLRDYVRRVRQRLDGPPVSHTWFAPSLHAAAISQIDHGQHSTAPTPEGITEFIDNNVRSVCRVAIADTGELAGYVVYLLQPTAVVLCELAVAIDWRRRGVASLLFSHVHGKLDRRRDVLVACRSERDQEGLEFLKSQKPNSCRLIRWRADLPGCAATAGADLVQFSWFNE
jgi:ribosomal protein S18 acetylase RimI-like enzyme